MLIFCLFPKKTFSKQRVEILETHMMTSSNGNIIRVTGHLCGHSPVTSEFTAQRSVTRALMFSLIYAWINGWVHNCEAGDLRRHRAHHNVAVTSQNTTISLKFEIISSTKQNKHRGHFTGYILPGYQLTNFHISWINRGRYQMSIVL